MRGKKGQEREGVESVRWCMKHNKLPHRSERERERQRERETETETERHRERDRQTDRQTDRQRQREGQRQRQRENSNSKTLILKDSSVRSIWTYLTASPCYTTNTDKHDYTRHRRRERDEEREREKERERQTDRQTDRQTENSKTLIVKDSSVRSIWTYLTASPCYTANTKLINTTVPQTSIISTIKQLINAVS